MVMGVAHISRDKDINFWTSGLEGTPVLLELPTDRPRPRVQDYQGASVAVTIPTSTVIGLRALSRRQGVTLFMSLLAGWACLLSRLSGQSDVVVGTPVANRQHTDVEPLIGLFVNTVALRVTLDDDLTVRTLLEQIKATTLQAYAHQSVPFDRVVEAVNPPRSLGHNPVFQAMLSLTTSSWQEDLKLAGLSSESIPIDRPTTQFDLSLQLVDEGEKIVGSIEYATALFDRSTIERWGGNFLVLLEAMVAHEQQRIKQLPMLSAAERHQLLVDFNQTHAEFPKNKLVHQIFEDQVHQTPQAVAVVSEAGQLTYAELNARANRVAHHLIGLGIGPDTTVAICVERSLAMVVGLLGILKAGGAYVPMDPSYPEQRLEFMIADSAPAALISQSTLFHRLPGWKNSVDSAAQLLLDDNGASPTLELQPSSNPDTTALGLTSQCLAYVIYTSGSTGTPKGVGNIHFGLANRLLWFAREFIDFKPVTALKTSIGFVDSVTECLVPLSRGGSVVPFGSELFTDFQALSSRIKRFNVNFLVIVPSLLRRMVDEEVRLDGVEIIVCSGERLNAGEAEQAARICETTRLFNFYGSSEVNGDSLFHEYSANDPQNSASASVIGRPISNTRIYILDEELQPVPLGVRGEICIGGDGLARGYLNRPELTRERFVNDPFSSRQGARLYRTGDLGRFLPDGNVEFLGRNDSQVKIRGFRIELGEVESRLATLPGVKQALVVAREDVPGDKRLVAYVVPHHEGELAVTQLRDHAAKYLPEYMVPSAFVSLASLPLTPNGKIDSRALPAPGLSAVVNRPYETPRGPTEQTLSQIWQELLGLESVGRQDNFFDLGGHSLLAVQLISRIRHALGKELPLRTLFAGPTVAQIGEALNDEDTAQAVQIHRADRRVPAPASSAQQRLWFIDKLDHAATLAYHIPVAIRLKGVLNRHALEASFKEVVARHEALRTSFVLADGVVLQKVSPIRGEVPLEHQDISGADESVLIDRIRAEYLRRFDLKHGPLIRAVLFVVHPEEHVLFIIQHHIVSDDWSVKILLRELSELYRSHAGDGCYKPPPLAIQYSDYASWEASQLHSEEATQQLSSWTSGLEGTPVLLELPTDRPRPRVQDYQGASVAVTIPTSTVIGLRALSRRQGVTLFMSLLAGWACLLSRLSGQSDVVVGTPVANRQHTDVEPLIGLFVNTVALRVTLDDDLTVRTLLEQIKATTLQAYAHQSVPFDRVVEAVNPPRSLGHNPVFQAMLSLTTSSWQEDLKLAGLSSESIPIDRPTTQFDLSLQLVDEGEKIVGSIEYATALFDRSTIERWGGNFLVLLEAMVAHEQQRIKQLPMLSAAERHQLLVDFNQTHAEFPKNKLVHQIFEDQVHQTPQAVAVVSEAGQLTYAELNARANRVAHHLIGLGIGPDTTVAICVERSLAMVVGLLGILKAGGAYVPMDPSYPEQRLEFMIADSAPAALISQSTLFHRLPGWKNSVDSAAQLLLDDNGASPTLELQPSSNPDTTALGLTSQCLAYVIYTSGSTGTPKGVAVEHRSVVNLVNAIATTLCVPQGCSVLSMSPLSFDIFGLELYVPLHHGGLVFLVSSQRTKDATFLQKILDDFMFTLVQATPATWKLLLESEWRGRPDLKVLSGGEAIAPTLAAQLVSRVHSLWNVYGPTETTIWSSAYKVSAHHERDGLFTSIGRPISNTQIYILDEELQPVPLGVRGEICIGGDGLARGYLNRPELTRERFVNDPFSSRQGARLYRTGDLGRFLPDGNVEFLGRNDSQVKIRGFRIELGEVESRLATLPGVKQALVVAREDVPGDKRLVAYVVPHHEGELAVTQLRDHAAKYLPEYMVPSAFVSLASLPLTPNGKIDSRALPAPGLSAVVNRPYETPRGPTEQTLSQIWQELLGLESVGRQDNFFDLGGHSLLAVQLISRIRHALGKELPLRTLFAGPTVAQIGEALNDEDTAQAVQIHRADRRVPAPASSAQQRLWFIDKLDHAATLAYHIPVAIRLKGVLNRHALEASFKEVVARHEALRTSFVLADGVVLQKVSPIRGEVPLEHQDISGADESVLIDRIRAEYLRRFDLKHGPLIRAVLFVVHPEEHVLFIIQHHIVSDDWSVKILLRELSELYRSHAGDGCYKPPPLAIQYSDYASWEASQLHSEEATQQLSSWTSGLEGTPVLLELPTDRPRPRVQDYQGASVAVTIPTSTVIGLRALSRRQGVTLFMSLLAGWACLLSRLSGQSDVVVGTPVANRQHTDVEPLIGLFVNTVALRVTLDDDLTVRTLLEQIKATTLQAYAHQSVPFDRVVEAVNPPRSLGHNPVFQAMLSLTTSSWQEDLKLAGLSSESIPIDRPTTQFDLSLQLVDEGEKIVGSIEYATALFDRSTIERWGGNFLVLLEAMVAHEQQRIKQLPMLSAAERHQLLVDFNQTHAEFPKNKLVHQIFEDQVHQTPQAVAVVSEAGQLTYAELNARANRVAHHLIGLGIGPDTTVAICVERSLAMVVGLLGILKAGGAYVPMDPSYPEQRLEFMIADSAPAALISQSTLFHRLPGWKNSVDSAAQLLLDDNGASPTLELQPSSNPDTTALGLTSQCLAYVIYTSGSTGTPKGVAVEHRSVVNFTLSHAAAVNLSASDCYLQFSSLNFDASVEEIFPALFKGSTVVLRSPQAFDTYSQFTEFTKRHRITVVGLPTAFWHGWIGDSSLGDLRGSQLRLLICGGEKANLHSLLRWLSSPVAQQCRIINTYGPTETTVYSTRWRQQNLRVAADVPIGRPISNTQIYILDEELQPVPLGVRGEICIGGDGLARGYLNRPELTRERFVNDPFSSRQGARLYRTGDLGRFLPDGNVEFLGRNDSQVKIRGFRIELGEVESRLATLPGVKQALVVAREDVPGDKRLVAYVVPHHEGELAVTQLRDHAAKYLPEYMVPSAFVSLASLPLTPNGKIDSRALPAPGLSAVVNRPYETPRGPTEQTLSQIWQELLGLESVGRQDNFFDLGGHSLLAVQLISRIRHALGKELPLRTLFAGPTLQQLAESIVNHRASSTASLVPIRPSGKQTPIFFIHPGEGEVGYVKELAPFLDTDFPIYALSAFGFLEGEQPRTSVSSMATAYLLEIQDLQPNGPYFLAGWSAGGMIAYELARLLRLNGESIAFLCLIDTPHVQIASVFKESNNSPYFEMSAESDSATLKRYRAVKEAISFALEHYLPEPIDNSISIIAATDSVQNLDHTLGWSKIMKDKIISICLDGSHYTLVQKPRVAALGRILSQQIRLAIDQIGEASEC